MSIFNRNNKYVQIGAYYCLDLNEYEMETHSHKCCEIMYSLKGKCTIGVENNQIVLNAGQFIFIDQYIPHYLFIEKGHPCSIANLEFWCSTKKMGLSIENLSQNVKSFDTFLNNPQKYLVLNDTSNMSYALKDLILELEIDQTHSEKDFITNLLLTRILIQLSRCAVKDETLTGLSYIKKAQSYIKEHFDYDLNVLTIAASVSINHTYLEKLFNKNLGCGIMAYVNRVRLQKAEFLLKNSSKSITEIAFEVGFNSRQHFGHAFENYYKVSPKEFRQKVNFGIDVKTKGFNIL